MMINRLATPTALALSLVFAAPIATTALSPGVSMAQDQGTIDIDDGLLGDMDSKKTKATLTINKFEGSATGQKADGKHKDVDRAPMDAEFLVYHITDLDYKDIGDWEAFSKIDTTKFSLDSDEVDGHKLGKPEKVTTKNGKAKVEKDLGFYLVAETPKPGRTTVAPFVISLPMMDQDDKKWNYDVQVHPKNQKFSVNKQVSDAYATVGNIIEYTLIGDTVDIPDGKTHYDRYIMVDRQPENITLDRGSVTVYIGDKKLGSKDYTVEDGGNSRDTKISLTEKGLGKLAEERKGNNQLQVRATITAEVKELTVDDKANVQTNTVYLYVDDGAGGDPNNPDDDKDIHAKVDSKFGKININKYGEEETTPLEGAEFELHRCAEGSAYSDSPKIISDKISVGGVSSWVTNQDGQVSIEGIQVEDFRDGKVVQDDFDYCLVEINAPNGYEILDTPIGVELLQDSAVADVDIRNIKKTGITDLPFTGGAGTMTLLGLSALIAVLGVSTLLIRGKRE